MSVAASGGLLLSKSRRWSTAGSLAHGASPKDGGKKKKGAMPRLVHSIRVFPVDTLVCARLENIARELVAEVGNRSWQLETLRFGGASRLARQGLALASS